MVRPSLLAAFVLLVTVAVVPAVAVGADLQSAGGTEVGEDTTGPGAGNAFQQSSADGERGFGAFAQADIESDTVALVASLEADGNATWEVVYRLELATEDERQAFEDQQEAIENDTDAYLDPFADRMERTVATASNATGREMSATNFAVSTDRRSQPQADFGVVTFEFRWTAFAAVEGDTIRAGDAIDQLFLNENERLEVNWPDGYSRSSSSPDPGTVDAGRVVWRGPIEFDAGQPRLVVTSDDGRSWFVIAGLVGAGAIAIGSVVLLVSRRRRDNDEREAAESAAGDAGGDGPPEAGPERATAGGDVTPATEVEDDEIQGTDADEAATGADSAPASPPSELLRNEERVLQLLEQHGGRMKQKAVAERLDWSAAKTSQVVGTLRENDAVESFRIGRENVLALPETGIADFDDDGPTEAGDGGGEETDEP